MEKVDIFTGKKELEELLFGRDQNMIMQNEHGEPGTASNPINLNDQIKRKTEN